MEREASTWKHLAISITVAKGEAIMIILVPAEFLSEGSCMCDSDQHDVGQKNLDECSQPIE